jgi:hypothetical protein
MIEITRTVSRKTRGGLPPNHGADRDKKLIASLDVGDVLTLRVAGRRHTEVLSLFDLYTMAVRNRVRREAEEKRALKRAKKKVR